MFSRISRIRALARITILDGIRRHALIGLVLFALAGVASGLLFIDFIPRDIGRTANDFIFSIIWITGFIFLLSHCVQVTAWDNERGSLHTFLSRPISRSEYAIAIYCGLAVLLLMLNIMLGGIGWWLLNIIKGIVSAAYFEHLSFKLFLLAVAGLYLLQLVLLSVILFFSSVIRGSFQVLLLTLCYYFICTGLPVVRESFKGKEATDYNSTVSLLVKWLTAFFPDFSWLDFKSLVASNDFVPFASQILVPFGLMTVYSVVAILAACTIYERRDLH